MLRVYELGILPTVICFKCGPWATGFCESAKHMALTGAQS